MKYLLILALLLSATPASAKMSKNDAEVAALKFSDQAVVVCKEWMKNQEKFLMSTWFVETYKDQGLALAGMAVCHGYISGYLARVQEPK